MHQDSWRSKLATTKDISRRTRFNFMMKLLNSNGTQALVQFLQVQGKRKSNSVCDEIGIDYVIMLVVLVVYVWSSCVNATCMSAFSYRNKNFILPK